MMKSFKEWLKLVEVGTMASAPTGGVGDIATFKMPIGIGLVRRTWPHENKKKKTKDEFFFFFCFLCMLVFFSHSHVFLLCLFLTNVSLLHMRLFGAYKEKNEIKQNSLKSILNTTLVPFEV